MEKCNCGDPNCKRETRGTPEGKLFTVNFFTCGKVKSQIEKAIKLKIVK